MSAPDQQLIEGLLRAGWVSDGAIRGEAAGQAWLYPATHTSGDRAGLIKVFRQQDEAACAVEQQALQRIARGSSARIAALLDTGKVAAGDVQHPFLVLERLGGAPLDSLIGRSLLSLHDRFEVLLQLSHGLAQVHAAGVVHGDVKPSNVLVCAQPTVSIRPADYLDVRVIDFGVATCLDASESSRVVEPRGSPLYAAPELAGDQGSTSPAVDIFGFGLLALDVLLDQPRQDRTFADDLASLELQLRDAGFPTSRRVRELIARCLEEREHRFKSGKELLAAWRGIHYEPDANIREPRSVLLNDWRTRVFGEPTAVAEASAILADQVRPVLEVVFLASLGREARRRAEEAMRSGRSLRSIVEESLHEEQPTHAAGKLARGILLQRVTVDGRVAKPNSERTLARGTLLGNAAASATRPAVRRVLLAECQQILAESELFSSFTLARLDARPGNSSWHVFGDGQREQPFRGHLAVADPTTSPILVRLSAAGRVDDDTPPLVLSPFARFVDGGPELAFSPFEAEPRRARSSLQRLAEAPQSQRSAAMTCEALPVELVRAGDTIHVLADTGQWLVFDRAGQALAHTERLASVARIVSFAGAIYLLRFDEMLARFHGRELSYLPQVAVVLSACALTDVLACGQSDGTLQLLDRGANPVSATRVSEPIASIVPVTGHGFAVLGSYGSLWVVRWPATELVASLVAGAFGAKLDGIFAAAIAGRVGIRSGSQIGSVDVRGQGAMLVATELSEDVREVLPLDDEEELVALGTAGDLSVVHLPSGKARRLHTPPGGGIYAGIARLDPQAFLAWTSKGSLLRVARSGAIRSLATDGVVLVRPLGEGELGLVRWAQGEALRLEIQKEARA